MFGAATYIGSRLQEVASLGSVVTAMFFFLSLFFFFSAFGVKGVGVGVDPQVQSISYTAL